MSQKLDNTAKGILIGTLIAFICLVVIISIEFSEENEINKSSYSFVLIEETTT